MSMNISKAFFLRREDTPNIETTREWYAQCWTCVCVCLLASLFKRSYNDVAQQFALRTTFSNWICCAWHTPLWIWWWYMCTMWYEDETIYLKCTYKCLRYETLLLWRARKHKTHLMPTIINGFPSCSVRLWEQNVFHSSFPSFGIWFWGKLSQNRMSSKFWRKSATSAARESSKNGDVNLRLGQPTNGTTVTSNTMRNRPKIITKKKHR